MNTQLNNCTFWMTDFYKSSNWSMYPDGLTHLQSYFESRSDDEDIVFFGLQGIIKRHLMAIHIVDRDQFLDQLKKFWDNFNLNAFAFDSSAFNEESWSMLLDRYHDQQTGKLNLPIRIRAVPEGSIIPSGNALFTVENTDPDFPWLVNYIEPLLMHCWYSSTVATRCNNIRKVLEKYAETDGSEVQPWHLNDFGLRGGSSLETSSIGGAAHLVSFSGTDNAAGIQYIQNYYQDQNQSGSLGLSVPASEHSTITAWGQDKEFEAYERIVDKHPNGLLSMVSDSYDYWAALDYFGGPMREKILSRNGKFVVRPDSGNPIEVAVKTLEVLYKRFPGHGTKKGYKQLSDKIGVIYGDGINTKMIEKICLAVQKAGFAISNIIFGSGGHLLQDLNRDTYKFAIKACSGVIDGKKVGISKNPVTSSMKGSKSGNLGLLVDINGNYETYDIDDGRVAINDVMRTVFENGKLKVDDPMSIIRERAGWQWNTA